MAKDVSLTRMFSPIGLAERIFMTPHIMSNSAMLHRLIAEHNSRRRVSKIDYNDTEFDNWLHWYSSNRIRITSPLHGRY